MRKYSYQRNNHKLYELPSSRFYRIVSLLYNSFLSKENRDRIFNSKYIPTLDDILRLRIPTSGIIEFFFDINSVKFRFGFYYLEW